MVETNSRFQCLKPGSGILSFEFTTANFLFVKRNQSGIKFIFLLLLGFGLAQQVYAQAPNEKAMIAHGEQLFSQREYEQAFSYYIKLKDLHPEVPVYQFRAGVCCIYMGDPEQALSLIKAAYDKDPNIPNINFFLGRAYLLNDEYDDASMQFNLQIAKESDAAERTRLEQYVVNCQAAKDLTSKPTNNKVKNAGRPLNSPGDEFAPILINNDSTIIFTYKGSESTGGKSYTYGRNDSAGIYYEDIFQSNLTRSGWFEPQGLSANLNTKGHDAACALSPDGKILFVYRNSGTDGGDIYFARKAGKDWTTPVKLPGEVNKPDSWEGSVTISLDGHTIYFASDRAGGFGGKDIYKATLLGDSAWGNVVNLGVNINTALDDDAPFLMPDGATLYFSSRGHNSMGGYDIFFSTLGGDMVSWELAQNMGIPVNSSAEDIYYQPTRDGFHAVFASNRKGGNGMMDIYFSDPGVPAKELVTIQGTVTLNGKPVGAIVTVAYTTKSAIQGDYSASAENGKYSINLPNGEDYKLYFQVSEQEEYSRTFDATQIKSYTTKEINVEFFSDTNKLKQTQTVMTDPKDPKDKIKMRKDSSGNFTQDDELAPLDPGYYIIVGSFKNKDFAKRLEGKEAAKGIYPKVQRVYNKHNGFMYVSIAHPATEEEAIIWVKEARKVYPDAWIQYLK
jgi:hypothetical protein